MAAAARRLLLAGLCLLPAQAPAADPLPVTEIASGVWVHVGVHEEITAANEGAIANVGFVVGGDAVAVIDTGGSIAEGRRLRAAIRAVTPLPIRWVVNTHVHPDHVLGNAAFRDDHPAFLGHARLPRALAARGAFYLERLAPDLGPAFPGTEIVPPTRTVATTLEIDLGDRPLLLRAAATAHTDDDLTVLDRATGTLWLGDLLFVDRIPALDGSLLGWIAETRRLAAGPALRLVPGHGPAPAPPRALAGQLRYLETLERDLRAVLARGGTMEDALATAGQEERDRWLLFDAYNPRNVVTGFTELEWE